MIRSHVSPALCHARIAAAVVCLALLATNARAQTSLGSEWTYQGVLEDGGVAVTGQVDMIFTLYDADTLGNVVGTAVVFDGQAGNGLPVDVTDGLFTAAPDFGANVLDGTALWIEVQVRSPHDPADLAAYTTLDPRPPITATPYALQTRGIFVDETNGNVGMGTTTPAQPLHVVGSSANTCVLESSNENATRIQFHNTDANYKYEIGTSGSAGAFGPATLTFVDRTAGGVSRMHIDSSGNLTIGNVSTPSEILNVAGNILSTDNNAGEDRRITVERVGGASIGIEAGTSAGRIALSDHPLRVLINADEKMRVDTAGNVGIGTATPTAPLHLSGSARPMLLVESSDSEASRISLSSTATGGQTWNLSSTADGSGIGGGKFSIVEGTSPRVVVEAGGNIGIGTGSPANLLTVNGNADFTGNVGIGTSSPGAKLTVSGGDLTVDRATATNGINRRLTLSGARMTGSASYASIDFMNFDGDGVLGTDYSGAEIQSRNAGNTDAGDLRFLTKSSADGSPVLRMRITDSGDVGIGITNPSEALHVVGNICATGTIGACSDGRFKKNVHDINDALEKVEHLRGVSFDWKREEFADCEFDDDRQIGFIAQEIENVIPEAVAKGSDGYRSVDYGRVTPVLVEAIKELRAQKDAEIASLRGANKALSAKNVELEARLARIEAMLSDTNGGAR